MPGQPNNPDLLRNSRSQHVWDTYLAYLMRLRTFREQCPWVEEAPCVRPLDKVWHSNLNQPVPNPYKRVYEILLQMTGTQQNPGPLPWAMAYYKSIRNYATYQAYNGVLEWNYVELLLSGAFQLDQDPSKGVGFVFTNWSKNPSVSGTFQFDPAWYGLQNKTWKVYWLVWNVDPQDPTLGTWNLVYRGALQVGTNPVHITIHSSSLQSSPEILFHDGTTSRPLKEREVTALLLSPS